MNLHFNGLEWYPLAALAGLLAEVGDVQADIGARDGAAYEGAFIDWEDNPDLKTAEHMCITHNGNRITLDIEDILSITIS